MTLTKQVILIDDEIDVVDAVGEMLELEGFQVSGFTNPSLALKSLNAHPHAVILCDVRMPAIDGLSLLSSIQTNAPHLPVLLMSGHGDIPMAIEAIKQGAFDFLEKPLNSNKLIEKLNQAMIVSHNSIATPTVSAGEQQDLTSVIIGQSQSIQRIRQQVLTLANTGVDTIINGETGTWCGVS